MRNDYIHQGVEYFHVEQIKSATNQRQDFSYAWASSYNGFGPTVS